MAFKKADYNFHNVAKFEDRLISNVGTLNVKIAEAIGAKAVQYTKEAMKAKKNGTIYTKNIVSGKTGNYNTAAKYRRSYVRTYQASALGEVIGIQPSWMKPDSRKGDRNTYSSLYSKVTDTQARGYGKGKSSVKLVIGDKSRRGQWKSEYIGNSPGRVYLRNEKDGWRSNRNMETGLLNNGRTSYGYGLAKALKNLPELVKENKHLLKKR